MLAVHAIGITAQMDTYTSDSIDQKTLYYVRSIDSKQYLLPNIKNHIVIKEHELRILENNPADTITIAFSSSNRKAIQDPRSAP